MEQNTTEHETTHYVYACGHFISGLFSFYSRGYLRALPKEKIFKIMQFSPKIELTSKFFLPLLQNYHTISKGSFPNL
jgi:hypothetical protein